MVSRHKYRTILTFTVDILSETDPLQDFKLMRSVGSFGDEVEEAISKQFNHRLSDIIDVEGFQARKLVTYQYEESGFKLFNKEIEPITGQDDEADRIPW